MLTSTPPPPPRNCPHVKIPSQELRLPSEDYSTWVERRPKKRCIEAGGKEIHAIRSPLPLPLPQAWAAQCGERHCPCGRRRIAVIASAPQPACPRSRLTPVAPGGSLQASMDPGCWFTLVPTGSSSLRQFPRLLHTWAPIGPRSCDTRLQADACEPRCPANTDPGFSPTPVPSQSP